MDQKNKVFENPIQCGGEIPYKHNENKYHRERLTDLLPWMEISEKLRRFMDGQTANLRLLKKSGFDITADTVQTMVTRTAVAGTMKERVDAYVERRLVTGLNHLDIESKARE